MRRLASAFALLLIACGSHHSGGDDAGSGDGSGTGSAIDAPASASPDAMVVTRDFPTGSLIIPMDLSYQATGMFQAYGLVYQLLKQGVHFYWVIDPNKTYHAADCNTPGDECAWDCDLDGSGVKCPYPTDSPDFTATTTWISDDTGAATRGDPVGTHAYRGGPFVIDAADHDAALAIIDAWNDSAQTTRSVFHVVTVHETTAPFTGDLGRSLANAP